MCRKNRTGAQPLLLSQWYRFNLLVAQHSNGYNAMEPLSLRCIIWKFCDQLDHQNEASCRTKSLRLLLAGSQRYRNRLHRGRRCRSNKCAGDQRRSNHQQWLFQESESVSGLWRNGVVSPTPSGERWKRLVVSCLSSDDDQKQWKRQGGTGLGGQYAKNGSERAPKTEVKKRRLTMVVCFTIGIKVSWRSI